MNDKRYVYIQPINKIYDTLGNKFYDADSETVCALLNLIANKNGWEDEGDNDPLLFEKTLSIKRLERLRDEINQIPTSTGASVHEYEQIYRSDVIFKIDKMIKKLKGER